MAKTEITQDMVSEAVREHSRRGSPEQGARLTKLFNAGEEIPSELLDFSGLRPEKETVGKLEAPPRAGKGSGKEAWIEFALEVSDLGEEVLEKMNRDEIVEILETREIIPSADDESEEG